MQVLGRQSGRPSAVDDCGGAGDAEEDAEKTSELGTRMLLFESKHAPYDPVTQDRDVEVD